MAYVEASVFASWMLGTRDRHYKKAEQVIDNIKSGKLNAITSSLTVMEVIDVIRKRITQWAAYGGHPSVTNLAPLKAEIEEIIQNFINGITAEAVQGHLILKDPNKSIEEMYEEASKILYSCFGGFGNANDCKFCERDLPSPKYFYRGVGQYDVQHAIVARDLGASTLITFDKGFNALSSYTNFNTLKFDVR